MAAFFKVSLKIKFCLLRHLTLKISRKNGKNGQSFAHDCTGLTNIHKRIEVMINSQQTNEREKMCKNSLHIAFKIFPF